MSRKYRVVFEFEVPEEVALDAEAGANKTYGNDSFTLQDLLEFDGTMKLRSYNSWTEDLGEYLDVKAKTVEKIDG